MATGRAGGANDVVLQALNVIPEPGMFGLLALGSALLLCYRRRQG